MVEDASGAKRSAANPSAPDSAAKRQKVAAPVPGDYPQFQLQTTITGHEKGVCSVKFSPDGNRLASASADKTCRIWDTLTFFQLAVMEGHAKIPVSRAEQGVSDVAWHPSGKHIATASDDNTLKLWVSSSGELLKTLAGHTHYVFCCAFSPKGNLLASGSFDETIRIWDFSNGQCLKELPGHADPITSLDFDRKGELIVSASYEGFCRIWEVATGACRRTIHMDEQNSPVVHVSFTPNGKYLLMATLDSTLRLWDAATNKCLKKYKGHSNSKHCVFAAFCTNDPDHRCIVVGSEDHSVCLYDVNGKQVVQKIMGRATAEEHGDGHCAPVLAVACHPTKSMLATGGLEQDCTVKVWSRPFRS